MWSTQGLFSAYLGENNQQQQQQHQHQQQQQQQSIFTSLQQPSSQLQAPLQLQSLQQLQQLQQSVVGIGVPASFSATGSIPAVTAAASTPAVTATATASIPTIPTIKTIPTTLTTTALSAGPPPSAAATASTTSNQSNSSSTDPPQDVAADIFGETSYLDGIAANVNIAAAFATMQTELLRISEVEKAAFLIAQRLKPQMLDHDHMLRFLLADNFNGVDAAKRLVRYWNDRYKLFGQDKFCLPLTLKSALKDDSVALSRGYVQLLPETDTAGRAVLYVDWSCHEPAMGYSEDSMHRVFWYMAHVAIEDANILKKGLVMLIYPQEARLDQFDHSLWTAISDSCKKSLPVRWRSTHIVHPNRFFSIVHPVFMSSLPKEVQDRVVVHSGTKMKVLANLLRYGLPWDRIPSDIGGCVDMDFENWLSDRMVKEDQMQDQKPPANSPSSLLASLLQPQQQQLCQAPLPLAAASAVTTNSNPTMPATAPIGNGLNLIGLGDNALGLLSKLMQGGQGNDQSGDGQLNQALTNFAQFGNNNGGQIMGQDMNFAQFGNNNNATVASLDTNQSNPPVAPGDVPALPPSLEPVASGSTSASAKVNDSPAAKSEKAPAKGPKTVVKSGRKSDPRMDRAVQAKLDDPDLSLVDALRKGGFVFPAVTDTGTPQYAIVDADNVKITQRKNQLLRRLRTTKKKTAEED